MMTHAALFNGIGGFQLAAEWMGWTNYMSCEIDSFCNKVTKYHFPNCIQHEDIRTTDFTIYYRLINILTGGFPCQPLSLAGKRKGKEDERYLWPEMLRAIREIQPDWVVPENVRGLINWNNGMVFDEVQSDLEAAGYEVFPFLLPAAGVEAPHERYRIWFVAHRNSNGCLQSLHGKDLNPIQRNKTFNELNNSLNRGIVTDTTSTRPQNCEEDRSHLSIDSNPAQSSKSRPTWERFPSESPFLLGDDGISTRLDGITFSKWRTESIKSTGNSIVPQLALQIFKTIEAYNNLNHV